MEIAGTCITVFIAVFLFFYKLVIVPLSLAIKELKEVLDVLRNDLQEEREKRGKIDIRLAVCETKIEKLEKEVLEHG